MVSTAQVGGRRRLGLHDLVRQPVVCGIGEPPIVVAVPRERDQRTTFSVDEQRRASDWNRGCNVVENARGEGDRIQTPGKLARDRT
jgi:hypothetical protein